MARITKKVRDGAILVAATYASSGSITNDGEMAATLGVPQESNALYWAAWNEVLRAFNDHALACTGALDPVLDAEVECLLRDGWSLGEPVEKRYTLSPSVLATIGEPRAVFR